MPPFPWRFAKHKEKDEPSVVVPAIDKLNEALAMLEKKEDVLFQKAEAEVQKSKECIKAKKKQAAMQCLKRKKLYDKQVEQIRNSQLRLHDQIILLEATKATTETVDVLRTGSTVIRDMMRRTNIDDVDRVMGEIDDQMGDMRAIQEFLSEPVLGEHLDDEELTKELEGLEQEFAADNPQKITPASVARATPVPARPLVRPPPEDTEEDQLAQLRAEMRLPS